MYWNSKMCLKWLKTGQRYNTILESPSDIQSER